MLKLARASNMWEGGMISPPPPTPFKPNSEEGGGFSFGVLRSTTIRRADLTGQCYVFTAPPGGRTEHLEVGYPPLGPKVSGPVPAAVLAPSSNQIPPPGCPCVLLAGPLSG